MLDAGSLTAAFDGCTAAFYLVHSMGGGGDFAATDARAAENFRDAADAAGVGRIVYLGGMGAGPDLSTHLESRHRVGEILASGATPTTELRAAVIIGSGSLSFEMLRYLTEVLPVMITPRWVDTRCQPIAIRDVLHYLVGVLSDTEPVDRILDIGGPDVLTYADMMQTYAAVAGLRRRIIVPVPVLSPSLSSRWVGLVTPLPSSIARPLIDSLRHEVVMTDHHIDELVPHDPIDFRTAVELAVRRTSTELVVTRWSDSGYTPADTIPGDPQWAGGATLADHQTVETTASRAALYEAFARIGGANGYYVVDWAWRVRGLMDRAIGGPGLRRGRRHPVELRPGESLDFWRVRTVDVGVELGLEAEMKVPGQSLVVVAHRRGRRARRARAAPDRMVRPAWPVGAGLLVRHVAVPRRHLRRHGPIDHPARRGRDGRSSGLTAPTVDLNTARRDARSGRAPALGSASWNYARRSGPTAPFGRSPTTRSIAPPSSPCSTTPGFAPSGGNRQPWRVAIVEDTSLRRSLADLMQPVWDEYLETAGGGSAPFNADRLPGPGDHLPRQAERPARRHRDDPRGARGGRRSAVGRAHGREARPTADHRRRVDLPVLLEPAVVGSRPWARRRDDDVPQPRRTGGRSPARPRPTTSPSSRRSSSASPSTSRPSSAATPSSPSSPSTASTPDPHQRDEPTAR